MSSDYKMMKMPSCNFRPRPTGEAESNLDLCACVPKFVQIPSDSKKRPILVMRSYTCNMFNKKGFWIVTSY